MDFITVLMILSWTLKLIGFIIFGFGVAISHPLIWFPGVIVMFVGVTCKHLAINRVMGGVDETYWFAELPTQKEKYE